ncbi:MAG: UDP-N-acetylmuramoyl-tripeptide--D-alanyl-D-alanine ligase [Syntrophomonadaceae bacterium]|nr:UDP-N-acetylmuramoyl-tripeptide--D-alanyl-D-alanine ligase [Syntrophomonadaceae bacterium]
MNSVLGDIARAVNGVILSGTPALAIRGVSLDSRKVRDGNLFFALQGENHDAHDFVAEALLRGAAAAVVSRPVDLPKEVGTCGLLRVKDVRSALQDLARWHRDKFRIHVVAVTGSVGKTTTKDLVAACLESRFKTLKTEGNYNNEIGVPLTLLGLEDSYRACVVEMAMRNRGEIAQLADIAHPTCAVIINVEPVHLETLGTMDNVAEAKCEVLKYIGNDGFAVINGDNRLLVETAARYPVRKLTFGKAPGCDFRLREVRSTSNGCEINASILGENHSFYLPVPGTHLAYNVLAAVGTALQLGVGLESIRKGLQGFSPSSRRMNIKTGAGGMTIIDDCYNANPVSMQAALQALTDIAGGSATRVAVLGDMYELGSFEMQGHQQVGRLAAELGIEHLVAVGTNARYMVEAAVEAGMDEERARHFPDKRSALEYLGSVLNKDAVILVKASRGMKMEEIVQALEERPCC